MTDYFKVTIAVFRSRGINIENNQPIRSQYTFSLPSENIRKPYRFLMFSEGRKRVHCEQMGEVANL